MEPPSKLPFKMDLFPPLSIIPCGFLQVVSIVLFIAEQYSMEWICQSVYLFSH